MELQSITPLILTWNEKPNIERTLAKLSWANRIVVVDSFSTDGTLELLRRDPRISICTRRFDSFADQCNFGLLQIDTEWVLSLDADYVCSDDLIREIQALPASPAANGFAASFTYCVGGRPLRGSLYPPRTVLYRRAAAQYVNDGHGHRVVVAGGVGRLSSTIFHDDRKPIADFLRAQTGYSRLEADKLRTASPDDLALVDRLRRRAWLVPLLTPGYCLLWKGLLLDRTAGLLYTVQRTYTELLIAMRLLDYRLRNAVARKERMQDLIVRPDVPELRSASTEQIERPLRTAPRDPTR